MMKGNEAVLAAVICVLLCVGSFGTAGVSAADVIPAVGGSVGSKAQTSGADTSAGAGLPVVEGSLLVTFEEDATEKKVEAAADKVDGELAGGIDEERNIVIIEIDGDNNEARAMRKLERLPQVKAVQPNFIYYADEGAMGDLEENTVASKRARGSAVSEYDIWHLKYMRVQEAWDLIDRIRPKEERTEEDRIKVAILDVGVYRHVDLQENMDWDNCVTVIQSEQKSEDSGHTESPKYSKYDDSADQHGTYVAGIIAATSYNGFGTAGVAAGNHNDLITLMGIKVFRNGIYKDQSSATTVDIVKGLRYARQQEARIINMCLGHEPYAIDGGGGYHDDELLKAEIDRAVKEDDVVITCPAGNNNDARTWYPSDFKNVISVINTTRYTNAWSRDVKEPKSSFGRKKDVSAPGAKICTTKGTDGYHRSTGTSYSASCAAGVAALVRYVNPELTAAEVKKILCSTATDLYKDGYDKYTGYGNLNAYKAVAKAAGIRVPVSGEKLNKATRMTKTRSVGKRTIEVNWKAVKGVAGYYLYRSTSKNGKYEKIAHIRDRKTTTYRDSGRAKNKKYYYKIATLGTSRTTKEKIVSKLSKPMLAK